MSNDKPVEVKPHRRSKPKADKSRYEEGAIAHASPDVPDKISKPFQKRASVTILGGTPKIDPGQVNIVKQ
jgi:hypothetical protein